jgi:hypothetical protein
MRVQEREARVGREGGWVWVDGLRAAGSNLAPPRPPPPPRAPSSARWRLVITSN